jgi:hypothetical protein
LAAVIRQAAANGDAALFGITFCLLLRPQMSLPGPERRFAALPQYVWYQGQTGLFADIAKMALMTHVVRRTMITSSALASSQPKS